MNTLITHDIYEWTTAITNILWIVVILVLMVSLQKVSQKDVLKVKLWNRVLIALAAVNILAFFVHAFEFSANTDYIIWAVMNLLLGLMITLMMSAAIYDYFNQRIMLKLLPYLIACALIFFAITQINRDTFLIFVAYQAIFTLLIFAIYIHLALKKFVGAWWVSFGVFFLILASIAQAIGRYELEMMIPLNQDGVFHLLAIPGTVFLILGVIKHLKQK